MKQHVSIARALKEKSRIAGRIHTLTDVINHENSLAEGSTRSVDIKETFAQVKALTEQLIGIKAAIAKGNPAVLQQHIRFYRLYTRIYTCTSNHYVMRRYTSERFARGRRVRRRCHLTVCARCVSPEQRSNPRQAAKARSRERYVPSRARFP